jgi:sterol 24-C-methyltransferase
MLLTEYLPTNLLRRRKQENKDMDKTATTFRDRFDGSNATVEGRKAEATTMVNEYYDIVTDFYEYGWGTAFHFAPRYVGEGFHESLCRHEYFLALKGGFGKNMTVMDIGCGVGGPLRNIVRFSGCNAVGINNNQYQIERAKRHDARAGLTDKCSYVRTDFMHMDAIADGSMDGAYAIEATCHAADKTGCFSEIFRKLKPGAHFVGYEWIVTDKYDDNNETHRRIRHGIEVGDALPTLETAEMVKAALRNAGFEVIEAYDVAEEYNNSQAKTIPWYEPLSGSYLKLSGLKATPVGRMFTSTLVKTLEFCRLAPKGSYNSSQILEEAAVNLVLGGEKEIFTPSYFFKARKPLRQ